MKRLIIETLPIKNPHKQLSRKIHNVELFFDVIVKGSVLRRKFDDRIRYCCMGGRMMVLKLMSK